MSVDAALCVLDLEDSLPVHSLQKAAGPVEVKVTDFSRKEITEGREFVDRCLSKGDRVYGSTTGFGPLVTFDGRGSTIDQCDNVLQHLTAGQGPDLPLDVVRAAVLARVRSLSYGRSGVSLSVIDALCAMLATSFTPAVPEFGSVGASGDLVPFAHVVQALRGNGHAYLDGVRMPADRALHEAGLTPLRLDGRDALALVNGTSLTTAAAALAVTSLRRSHRAAALLTALLADLLGAGPAFAHPGLLAAYGHPAVEDAGRLMRETLRGGRPSGDRPLQEPYSIRCAPQLLGAARGALDYAEETIGRDLNGVSDNPLFFLETGEVAHGGNFFGQPCAFACDHLSLVAAQIGNLAERQLDMLTDPHRNGGRPPMLSPAPGEQHALQGVQVAATSLVVAMRRRTTPAAAQSVPTNLHNQDVVPFGTQAALTAYEQAGTLRLLHGSLAIGLRQAAHVGDRGATAPGCADLLNRLCESIPPIDRDRPLHEDVRTAADVLDTYTLAGSQDR
ncbi:aromatic amino acid ammonia-lyase [Streptomyces flaveolus]|uniref:HAL/PAL/TAL family ammonia-lyase n=1 Tax=Streptomyces flaveolus TaxID=67297 RepID=UPI003430CBBC